MAKKVLDTTGSDDYIGDVDSVDIENTPNEGRLGPPRLTRLDPETDEVVLRIAETEERSVAQVIRRLVRDALASQPQQRRRGAA